MLLFALSRVLAATPTELPPFLRGDITVGYAFDHQAGGLQEFLPYGSCEDTVEDPCTLDVGDRTITEHRLHYGLTFGVYNGVALRLDLPHYALSEIRYKGTGSMILDAATNTGTYKGVPLDPESSTVGYTGSGLGGTWLEVEGTPFSEAFTKRNNKATWLVAGAVRFPDSTDRWAYNDGTAKYGAGPGGTAFRLRSAFSKKFGASEPYFSFSLTSEGAYNRRLINADGVAQLENDRVNGQDACAASTDYLSADGTCIPIYLGTHVDLLMGVELGTAENPNSGGRFSTDLHWGVRYGSWASVPSGSYLPGVLGITAGRPELQSESLEAGGGLGFNVRFFKYLEWRLGVDGYYHAAQRVESQYPIYTGPDTYHLTASTDLVVRIR